MGIANPPVGILLDNQSPINGGMRTGNLILNGDMELIEYVSTLWQPSLFTLGAEAGTTAVWESNGTTPYAGLYDLRCKFTDLTINKTAYFYQDIPLNPGGQYDQLSLWHRLKFTHKEDAGLAAIAALRATFTLILSSGSTVTLLTWDKDCYSADWQTLTKEFRPSLLTTRANIDAAVTLRVTLAVVPASTTTPGAPLYAYFDDVTLEAEAAFSRNFAVGSNFDWERDTAFERGNDQGRTMYQSSAGMGTAKRAGNIVFNFITEAQMIAMHGLWLYGARSYVRWYPVMATYPSYVDMILAAKWPFKIANADADLGYSGTLSWAER